MMTLGHKNQVLRCRCRCSLRFSGVFPLTLCAIQIYLPTYLPTIPNAVADLSNSNSPFLHFGETTSSVCVPHPKL